AGYVLGWRGTAFELEARELRGPTQVAAVIGGQADEHLHGRLLAFVYEREPQPLPVTKRFSHAGIQQPRGSAGAGYPAVRAHDAGGGEGRAIQQFRPSLDAVAVVR